MNLRMLTPIFGTLLLASLASLIGYAAIIEQPDNASATLSGPDIPSSEPPSVERNEAPILHQTERPAIYYQAIVDRPLFAPTRRQYVAPSQPEETPVIIEQVEEEPAQATLPNGLRLSGVLGGAEDRSVLLIHDDDLGTWFRVGDKIDEWTISETGPDWVELVADDQKFRLELFQ